MKVRALRGVCIGPERHLVLGETADLAPSDVQFLVSIGAVEKVVEPPPPAVVAIEPETESKSPEKNPGRK